MFKKNLGLTIILFLIIFISIGIVSADDTSVGEVNSTFLDDNSTLVDEDVSNHTHTELSKVLSDSPVKKATINAPGGTFTDLYNIINGASAGDTIVLSGNYKYNSGTDSSLVTGISITKTLTIVGNNFTINGSGVARIFVVSANNVKFDNVTFTGGYTPNPMGDSNYRGGAIFMSALNFTVINCYFFDNYAITYGSAIEGWGGSSMYVINSTFINNGAGTDSTIVVDSAGGTAVGYITGCTFIGNRASGDRYSTIYLWTGYARYNYFYNNTGKYVATPNNYDMEYNWWGNNTPVWTEIFWRGYGGTYIPQTYVVMESTNTTPLSSGNLGLAIGLNKIYNSSSGNYTTFEGIDASGLIVGNNYPQTKFELNNGVYTCNVPFNIGDYLATIIDNQAFFYTLNDLDVLITVSNQNPIMGDTITFNVYLNSRINSSTPFSVNFTCPSELFYQSYIASTGSYSSSDGLWTIPTLKENTTYNLKVDAFVPYDGTLVGKIFCATAESSFVNGVNKSSVPVTVQGVNIGSYTDLQNVIDRTPVGGTIKLTSNVTYDPVADAWLQSGMRLNKTVSLVGDGVVIDGLNMSRIFIVTAANVLFENITFTHGYTVTPMGDSYYRGGAIFISASNFRVINCNFINNYAITYGSAIEQWGGSTMYVINSTFINNSAGTDSTIVVDSNGAVGYITGCTFIGNSAYGDRYSTIYLYTGYANYNVFYNNTGKPVCTPRSYSCDYNWWGTNNPVWSNIFFGNSYTPTTWFMMNFSNVESLGSGSFLLRSSLDVVYNKTINAFQNSTYSLPARVVYYESTVGSFNSSVSNITGSGYVNFTYSSGSGYVNASIDSQVLTLPIGGVDIDIINVSTYDPQIGSRVTFYVKVSNNGPYNINSLGNDAVIVNFTFPSIFSYFSSSVSGGLNYNNTTNLWYVGNLSAGESKYLNLTLKLVYNKSLVGNIINLNTSATGYFISKDTVFDNVTLNITDKTSGSYTDLQDLIDTAPVGSTINIPYNITYDPIGDAWLQTGMRLNKTVSLVGNGVIIDGLNVSRIFIVTAPNVLFENITFTHGYTPNPMGDSYYRGGAIFISTTNFTVLNCTFIDNYAITYGSAIEEWGGSSMYVINSTFINNSAGTDSTVVVDSAGGTAWGYITGCTFVGNSAYGDRYSALYLYAGYARYNVFYNNTGKPICTPNNYDLEYNWWGNNTPVWTEIFWRGYGGTYIPQTYVVMDFDNIQPITSSGGTSTLVTTLDSYYNTTSNNITKLIEKLPFREVYYNNSIGSLSVTNSPIQGNNTTDFTFPAGMLDFLVSAKIDGQTLFIGSSELIINISVSNSTPRIFDAVNYTITIQNKGLLNVTNISVTFYNNSFLYISDTSLGTYNSSTGIWTINNLTVGETKNITIVLRVPWDYTLVNKTLTSNVTVNGSFSDLNTTNNFASVNVTIQNKTGGSYTELQYLIDTTPVGGVLNLTFNVTYDPIQDAWLQTGMQLNKSINLIGNGYTINGLNISRIFVVTANNVLLDNITFTKGFTISNIGDANPRGGAIFSSGSNFTVINCTFIDNYATKWGSAIEQWGPGYCTITDCAFINNTADMDSTVVIDVTGGGATGYITGCLFEGNRIHSDRYSTIYLYKGYAHYNVFTDNDAYPVCVYDQASAEYNWWGNNTPNWNMIFWRGIGGSRVPQTWIIMNFTNTTPITTSGGTDNLLVTLNTLYNSTTNTTSNLTRNIPYRTVQFNWTQGTVTPNTTPIQGNATSTFTYPSNMGAWIVNATIDNQTLSIGSADIEIIITPNKNPVDDGDNITFNITVRNNGLVKASNINLTLFIPYGLFNITTYTNNGTFNNTTMLWTIGDLNVLENVTLTLNGTLENPGEYLLLNATIDTNHFYDNNLTNHNVTYNLTVIQWSDLEITKNVSDLHPDTKENVTYIITVYNYGPSTAKNVTVFDNLSSKLIYQSFNATNGYYNETTCIWFIDNITSGSNETINITVFINQSGITDNFVNVTSLSNDTNWTNNYANISFETAPLSDLWVTINMEPQSSNYITYHIQAGNNGIEAANGTVVVFNLSNLYVWFNHTTDKGIYNNDTGVWDIGYLDVNETVNMTLIVRLDFPMGTTFANITTSVNITSWSTDLYPENNTDNITFEAEIFGNFRLLQDIVDGWAENTTQILPRSFAYDPIQDAKLPGETYDLINGVRLYKNLIIVNPNGFTLGGFDMARIFNISADNVILDGLKFFDGNSPLGAALNIHADNVQVLRSNFSRNWLYGDYGGAIYTNGRNTLIMDNIFTENTASKLGGAIGAVGAVNLKILNNTFINNSVESDEIFGGAIGLINTTAIVNGNVFLDNVATSSSGLGSAIYTDNSNVDLEANWFGNNTPDMVTDELIWGVKPETYIVLDWEISNPNMAGVTLNAVFFLYNTTTGNKTPLGYGIPYRSLTVTARDPTVSWYNSTFTGNNTFNYTYNPSIPVYQVNATVDYETITLEWSTFLSVNKTLLNDTVWFGDDLIYNITLVNYGPHDSYIVTISDLLPNDLIINTVNVLYGSTSIIGDNVYWSVVINAGDTLTLIVNTTPTKEKVYINNITVNSTSQYDYFLWGNMSVTGEVLPLFDLSINFTISNSPYYVGEEINYTITIHNNGPSNASNVSVYIPIPSGLTFLYAWNLEGYIPNYTTSTGLWTVDTLHVNETIQINMTLRLDSPNWYNQTVNISGYGVELNETDNNSTLSFNVTTQVDLELNMTISTNETLYGSLVSVTYSLLNKGPSPAMNTSVFTVFSGLTYSSSTGYGSFSNITPFTGYWYVGTLNKNTSVSLTLYFYANTLGDFTVTGRANCSDNESYWLDNYDNVTLKVIKYADLTITKIVSNSTPYVGQVINYTITVKNNAGFNTENVTVYDNLSEYLIYDGSNPNFNGTHWFVGNLSVGESKNITFNVTVNESGLIWNNATVNSSLNDSNINNNHAEVSINAIYKYADLSITKTVSSSTPFLEQTITYTITVTNLAGFDTENVTVYDTLPSVLIYNNTNPNYNGTVWFVGNLSVGESKNITFDVTVDGIGVIWNNATVNSSLRDPNTLNNHAEVSISVPVADDLRMYISTIPTNPSSNNVFIINLSVWNRGFTDNQNVTVEFHIPSSLTYVNSTNMGAYNPITGFWNIGFLGNGQWTDLQIWVYPSAVGNVTLEANVSGQVADVAPWNNRANITFEIIPSFDLTITKSANATILNDGDLIGFDITVWNNGPYLANNVQITDYLSNGVLYYSNNASGIYDNNTRTVNWIIPVMNMGDNFTFHLTCLVWNSGLNFTNTVAASAYGTDSNLTDNTATITVNVTPNNDLEVKINASKTKDIDLGENIVFYITVLNHGPSNATNVIAHFSIPSIFSHIMDNSGGNYILSSGDWLIGNLGSGNNVTLEVTVNLTSMGVCTANATVNSTYVDKNLSNNYDEINLTATPFFDLNITAYWNLTNNTLVWQNLANLTIIVSNDGPENATNIIVQINVPGVSYVNDTSLGNLNTTTWVWNVGNLSVGEYKNITITFRGEDCGFYWTTGNITGHGHDTNLSNNNYALNLSIIPIVDLIMTNLTVNTTYAGIDEILEFNVTVYNKGPCNATNVTIVGFLPLNWIIYAGSLVADIPVNTSHTFNIFVNASTYGNFTVGFNATINGIDTYPLDNNKTIGPIEIIYHANLMITIKVNNQYPVTGDMIVYVITVSNLDWRTAHNVTANITVPGNLTLDHYYLASGSYNVFNGTWTIGNLSFRNSTSMFLFCRVNNPGSTDFWVNVTGEDYDFYPKNNNDTINITTTQGLDLSITITTVNSTPYTGDNITFTVTVENIGLLNATGTNVEINIPTGFINPTSADLNFTGNSWYVGDLNIGDSKSFNFTVIPIVTNNLTVNVSVGASRYDYNSSNNFANITISPISASDLEINITCNNTTPMLNENVTYTISILNKGMISVDNVIIFNNLPYSLAYSTSIPIYSPSSKMWSLTSLAPNTIETLNITINHTSTGIFNFTANITGNIIDTNITNNQDNLTVTVSDYNDLYTEFTVSNSTVLDNNILNFTITVYNNGSYNDTDVKVYTNLPNTKTYYCSGIFDTNLSVWNVGNLSAGENKTLTLLISMANVGNYTYWANSTGKQYDKNLSNNNQSLNISVYADYDLKVNITLLNNNSLNVGENITFTVTVYNDGPSTTHNVNITHDFYGTISTINVGNLSMGKFKSYNITITPTTNGTYVYGVNVTSDNIVYDRNITNNYDNITIAVINSVDLVIIITSNSTIVNKSDIVEILVNVYNNASCTAHNVYVNTTGLFDSNVLTTMSSAGFIAGDIWFIPTINPHQNTTLNITKTIINKNLITANVTSNDVEIDNNTNNASLFINITSITDLKVTITTNSTNISLMDNVTFTVTVYNLGEDTAEDVKVYLDLPYSTVYSDVYMYDSMQNIWSIGTLTNGTNRTLNITVIINNTGLITFNASVNSSTKDNYTNNNYDNITINVTKLIDLEITITSNITDTMYAGDLVEFMVKVVNHGPSNATNVGINFNLPYNFISYNMGVVSSSYWYIGNLATNETGILNLTRLLAVGDDGTYNVNITGFENERNISNNFASTNLTLNKSADLAITITSNLTNLEMGELVLYTVNIVNYGPDSITNANANFIIPANFNITFNMTSNGVFNGTDWILSSLGTGGLGIATLYIEGYYNGFGNKTINTMVNSSFIDKNLTNNIDNVSVFVNPALDLSLNFTSNAFFNSDGTITFNITVTNLGPANATNITVRTNLPETDNYNTTNGYFDTLQDIWYIDTLNIGDSETILINTLLGNSTVFYANVTNNVKELNTFDNIKWLNITTNKLADLSVNITMNNTNPILGDTVIFTITITNLGPYSASNVIVLTDLPANPVYTLSKGLFSTVNGKWSVGNLSVGEIATLNITLNITNRATFEYHVNISGSTNDTNLTNNNDTINFTVAPTSNLSINLTVNQTNFNIGDNVTFTINVNNYGPSNATNVNVSFEFPTGFIYNPIIVSIGTYSTDIWSIPNFENNTNYTLNITGILTTNGTNTFKANITSETYDNDTINNYASLNLNIENIIDLEIHISSNLTNILAGEYVNIYVNVTNNGPGLAKDVLVKTNILNATSIKDDGYYDKETGTWYIGNLNTNNTVYLNLTIQIIDNITYIVRVNSSNHDNNTLNNNNTLNITTSPICDLDLTLSANNDNLYLNNTLTYTITVTNKGYSLAENVNLTTNLTNTGFSFISSNDTNYNNITGLWTIGNINTGETVSIKLKYLANVSGNITVEFYVNTTTLELNTNNNNKNITIFVNNSTAPVTNLVDLIVNITVDNPTPNLNDIITFNITIYNNASTTATNVTIKNFLPTGLTPIGTYIGNWTISSLGAYANASFTFQANVTNYGSFVTNVTANSNQWDANPIDNRANVLVVLNSPSGDYMDLIINVTRNGNLTLYETFTYNITVTNIGPSTATNVNVTISLFNGLNYVNDTSMGAYNFTSSLWNIGNLGAGENKTIIITLNITQNGYYNNAFLIYSNEMDKNPQNNLVLDNFQINDTKIDVSVKISANKTYTNNNETLTFTVTVINHLNPATNVNITFNIPNEFNIISFPGYTNDSYYIGNMLTGKIINFTFTATLNSTNSSTITVNATLNETDSYLSDNYDTITITPLGDNINGVADLCINITVNEQYPEIETVPIFNVWVTNYGPDDATNVEVPIYVPADCISTSADTYWDNITSTFRLANLSVGSTVKFEVSFRISTTNPILFNASAKSDQFDPNITDNKASISLYPWEATPTCDLNITIVPIGDEFHANDTVKFNVTIRNFGEKTAFNVSVCNIVPPGLTLLNISTTWAYTPTTDGWFMPNHTINTNKSFILTYKIDNKGLYQTTIEVNTSTLDVDPTSNGMGVTIYAGEAEPDRRNVTTKTTGTVAVATLNGDKNWTFKGTLKMANTTVNPTQNFPGQKLYANITSTDGFELIVESIDVTGTNGVANFAVNSAQLITGANNYKVTIFYKGEKTSDTYYLPSTATSITRKVTVNP